MQRPVLNRDGRGKLIFGKSKPKAELPFASYVYLCFHPMTGEPMYVGKGTGNRFDVHTCSHNKQLKRTIKKYGKENVPVVIVRDGMLHQEAFALEIMLIAVIGRADKRLGPLVNHTDGGEGVIGYKVTPEQLKARGRAISIASMGKVIALETRSKISSSVKAVMATEEVFAKTSAGQRARFLRPDEVEKARQRRLGKPLTLQHKVNISLGNQGREVTEETREKLRIAMEDYPQSAKDAISRANTGRIRSEESKVKNAIAARKIAVEKYSDPKEKRLQSERMKQWWAERKAAKLAIKIGEIA